MKTDTLHIENFLTLLAQIESILNSRPLVPSSDDPNDMTVLTPAHSLVGRLLKVPLLSSPKQLKQKSNFERLATNGNNEAKVLVNLETRLSNIASASKQMAENSS